MKYVACIAVIGINIWLLSAASPVYADDTSGAPVIIAGPLMSDPNDSEIPVETALPLTLCQFEAGRAVLNRADLYRIIRIGQSALMGGRCVPVRHRITQGAAAGAVMLEMRRFMFLTLASAISNSFFNLKTGVSDFRLDVMPGFGGAFGLGLLNTCSARPIP